ncbi:coiled-coil domain-containing protein 84 isoform X2 [Lacerta agilis]|uniref:coiled-coil domain-containing protein 84 isoform X2 n=1 Tax=Lacerta agilis TaxID=80427 RepID=UPI00141A62AA|nr:coiled-coil domain-containing protein 84 isoform X2 [Lacerta agilis]
MEDGGGGGGVDGDRGEGPGAVPMATTLFRCPLCRCSAFAGRRSHLYSAGHQRRLRGVLARLKEKVAAARKMLKRALVVPFDPGEHERQFWCVCCRQEVKLHLSQGSLAVLHGGLLQHMASVEHKKAVYAFWWENRADPSLKSRFLVSSEDYELFKASLSKALDAYEEKEDELIQEQQAETELCNGAATANAFTGSPSDSAFATEEQEQLGPSRNLTFLEGHPGSAYRTVPESEWQEAGQSLTFIGHQEPAEHGNIYTGAKPPWLMEEEGESTAQIGPSYEEFLKEKEKQKLKKLPPNRVGANFDHTSQTGEGWLPSFGRVWNHGRRWQSRHQFKSEAQKHPGPKRKQQKTD